MGLSGRTYMAAKGGAGMGYHARAAGELDDLIELLADELNQAVRTAAELDRERISETLGAILDAIDAMAFSLAEEGQTVTAEASWAAGEHMALSVTLGDEQPLSPDLDADLSDLIEQNQQLAHDLTEAHAIFTDLIGQASADWAFSDSRMAYVPVHVEKADLQIMGAQVGTPLALTHRGEGRA